MEKCASTKSCEMKEQGVMRARNAQDLIDISVMMLKFKAERLRETGGGKNLSGPGQRTSKGPEAGDVRCVPGRNGACCLCEA